MDDHNLIQHYFSLREPEAYQWNLSPRSLYMEMETRDFFLQHFEPKSCIKICNVGIGVGEWDDFLGYVLHEKGKLTSMDIDSTICELFQYRQQREGHLNPSSVRCADFLNYEFEVSERFHLVTLIGSTLHEIGQPERTVDKVFSILDKNGCFFLMNMERYMPRELAVGLLQRAGFSIKQLQTYERYSHSAFYCILAQKQEQGGGES
ncbi:class I SAM-dependent methyltransferase [Paenibacillus sp. CAU 1782]